MDVILKIVQVILSLSLLVLVHEFGHYIFARIFKIRVEKFYLFFPPAIFKYKPKNSDTEFGIGSIPVGGFCKISGMVDESMDTEALTKEPQPWEFRSRPAWQRFFVMFGGVLMNFILAIILYICILWTWGEQYIKTEDAVYGIQTNALSSEIGFNDGDRLLMFDGETVPDNFHELQVGLVRNQVKDVLVLRDGDSTEVNIDPVYIPAILNTPGMFGLRVPIAVASFPDSSINKASGLETGDRFLYANGQSIAFYNDLQNTLGAYTDSTILLTMLRGTDTLVIPAQVSSSGKLEVLLQADVSEIKVTEKKYTLAEAIPAGAKLTFTNISNYIKEIGLMFRPDTEAYKSVGSFITIGSIFPSSWNWQIFWNITALLSVMLAVLNLLPIPALDGGHIVILLYEIISGRKPSQKFLEVTQMIGMVLLIMLMILAFGNDITRIIN